MNCISIIIIAFYLFQCILFRGTALAFHPVYISATEEPEVRQISIQQSEKLRNICGKASRFLLKFIVDSHFYFREVLQYSEVPVDGQNNYPWAISVTAKGRNKLGGVIISQYHILTAAHPFINFTGFSIAPCRVFGYRKIVELQLRNISFGGKCIRGNVINITNDPICEHADVLHNKIKTVVVDDDFVREKCTKGHDWAIIEVERPFTFSSKVQPICLPSKNESLQRVLTIFGWGRTSRGASEQIISFDHLISRSFTGLFSGDAAGSSRSQKSFLSIAAFFEGSPLIHETPMQLDENCRAPWSDTMPTKVDDYICMKSLDPDRVDTPRICYGDSGCGMQQISDDGIATVVGITSYGLKGCPPNELARFTRVDHYLHEICQITGVCYSI